MRQYMYSFDIFTSSNSHFCFYSSWTFCLSCDEFFNPLFNFIFPPVPITTSALISLLIFVLFHECRNARIWSWVLICSVCLSDCMQGHPKHCIKHKDRPRELELLGPRTREARAAEGALGIRSFHRSAVQRLPGRQLPETGKTIKIRGKASTHQGLA